MEKELCGIAGFDMRNGEFEGLCGEAWEEKRFLYPTNNRSENKNEEEKRIFNESKKNRLLTKNSTLFETISNMKKSNRPKGGLDLLLELGELKQRTQKLRLEKN